jgi:hypothetical protein
MTAICWFGPAPDRIAPDGLSDGNIPSGSGILRFGTATSPGAPGNLLSCEVLTLPRSWRVVEAGFANRSHNSREVLMNSIVAVISRIPRSQPTTVAMCLIYCELWVRPNNRTR